MGLGSFLEDFDKANVPARLSNVTKGLSDIQQLETNKIQQKSMLADIELKENAKRVADYNFQKAQEQDMIDNTYFEVNDMTNPTPPANLPDGMHVPKAGVGLKNWATEVGLKTQLMRVNPATGKVETNRKNFRELIKMVGENKQLMFDSSSIMYTDLSQQITTEEANLPNIKKPAELKVAQENIAMLKAQRQAIAEQLPYLNDELLKEKIKGEMKSEGTPSWKTIEDKTSPTGYSYQDLNTGKTQPNAPAPKALIEIGGLGKTTQNKLETEIIEADTKIEAFNEVEKLFKPEYLTYKGEGIALAQKYGEKAGIPLGTDFLKERATWKQQSQTVFLEWRKWITGVSGGEKEMQEIAKSFPDPGKNSPTEFIANLVQARKWTKKARNRLIMLRSLGIDSPTKDELKQFPLNDIPEILPKQSQQSKTQSGETSLNITDENLQFTADKYGLSIEEVKQMLGVE